MIKLESQADSVSRQIAYCTAGSNGRCEAFFRLVLSRAFPRIRCLNAEAARASRSFTQPLTLHNASSFHAELLRHTPIFLFTFAVAVIGSDLRYRQPPCKRKQRRDVTRDQSTPPSHHPMFLGLFIGAYLGLGSSCSSREMQLRSLHFRLAHLPSGGSTECAHPFRMVSISSCFPEFAEISHQPVVLLEALYLF